MRNNSFVGVCYGHIPQFHAFSRRVSGALKKPIDSNLIVFGLLGGGSCSDSIIAARSLNSHQNRLTGKRQVGEVKVLVDVQLQTRNSAAATKTKAHVDNA